MTEKNETTNVNEVANAAEMGSAVPEATLTPEEREAKVAELEKTLMQKYNEVKSKIEENSRKTQQYEQNVNKLNETQKAVEQREKEVKRKEEEAKKQEEKLQKKAEEILKRENDVKERENAIDQREKNEEATIKKIQLEEKAKLEAALAKERSEAVSSLNDQLTQERTAFEQSLTKTEKERMEAVEKEIADKKKEFDEKITEEIEERTREVANREKKAKESSEANKKREEELDSKEKELEEREAQVKTDKRQNDREKRRLNSKEEDLNAQEVDIKSLIEKGMSDKIADFNCQLAAKDASLNELRDKIKELMANIQAIETFKVSIGADPAIIDNKIKNLNRTIEELKEELAKRASGEIQKERDKYKADYESQKITIADLEKKNRILQQKNDELSSFEVSNVGLVSKNQELESLVNELQGQNDNYRQRIERLSSTEARLSDRDQRIAEINKGYLTKLIGANLTMEKEKSEIDWLNDIYKRCDEYGIHFPQRILYAFHTALKISDWSSVTVLAGVSGTGKSELPKLYAAFGGMNFINVPVQPSWDSQESMLGFFNSIDNRFEPEPLLRFLVQCTENDEYSPYMSIVLLDEMNLAHVEYYFADFLSKLETRRGASKTNVPTVEVKLGAGVEPYQLKLERSVLWTGTMNQDETTKSLSDKVLDRGLVINFPRPRELNSRVKMGFLDKAVEEANRPMLNKNIWGNWIVRKVDLKGEQEEELNKYKKIVEDINNELEHVGRALGHRVWQSIEYYIINYPTVVAERKSLTPGGMSTTLREAMKVAFEDQIVQKIMPKLRGVETRGRGKENLERIEALLEDKGFERLKDDFEIACEQGYGQFIWSSAKYIETDEAEKHTQSDVETSEENVDPK